MGELDSTLRREQSALKAFVTATKDTYRQPYARVAVNRPRRTNFCATVNPAEFLVDETGSRRFWVIEPKRIDLDRLRALTPEWVAQLWRQIYEQYYLPDPEGYRLTEDEKAELQRRNRKYNKTIPGEIEIMDSLDWEKPISEWKWKKVSDVKNMLYEFRFYDSQKIGRVLAKMAVNDPRIKTKNVSNYKYYLLPPEINHILTVHPQPMGSEDDESILT